MKYDEKTCNLRLQNNIFDDASNNCTSNCDEDKKYRQNNQTKRRIYKFMKNFLKKRFTNTEEDIYVDVSLI